MQKCKHCGTRFESTDAANEFCCAGCEYVYSVILGEGLERFYELKGGKQSAPARQQPFAQLDWSWLQDKVQQAEEAAKQQQQPLAKLKLGLNGISCAGCVWLCEKVFSQQNGAYNAEVWPASGSMQLSWQPGACDVTAFARELQQFGYVLVSESGQREQRQQRRYLMGKLGICAAFMMNGMAFSLPRYLGMPKTSAFADIFELIVMVSASLALLIGGSEFFKKAWFGLKNRTLHMDVPISLGVILAWFGSFVGWRVGDFSLVYFEFVATFIFLMLVGRWVQLSAVERAQSKVVSQELIARSYQRSSGEKIERQDLQVGDEILVGCGQVVPVCGRLDAENGAELGFEWINGEAEARHLPHGADVAAGAINVGKQPVKLQCSQAWQGSMLAGLLEGGKRDTSSKRINGILKYYILIVLLVGVAGLLYWGLVEQQWTRALQVMISVYVVSCPCALGVALPLLSNWAASRVENHGVFINDVGLWERLARIKHVWFDKTGTLTLESALLLNVESLQALDAAQIAKLNTLIAGSPHPLARALRENLARLGWLDMSMSAAKVQELPGKGLRFVDEQGGEWQLGRPDWACAQQQSQQAQQQAMDCVFAYNGALLARFEFSDAIRPDAAQAIGWLQQQGYSLGILSGDRQAKVERVARELGIDEKWVHARLSPEQKQQLVAHNFVAKSLYVGDGANDALAFDQALVTGTPVVDSSLLEQRADFYFLGRSLGFMAPLLKTSALHQRAVRLIFAFALVYNIAVVVMALLGHMQPVLAAIFMPVSSLVTIALGAWVFRAK